MHVSYRARMYHLMLNTSKDLVTPVNTVAAGCNTQICPMLILSNAEIVWDDRLS